MVRFLGYALVALVGLSCAEPRWVYAPVWTESAEIVSSPAAVHRVGRVGEVRVTTLGLAELDGGARAVHLRFVVVDRGAESWSFDGAAQRLELDTHELLVARTAELGAPPRIVIGPGETRAVDLFFVLPRELHGARDVRAFTAVWTLDAGSLGATGERTTFERFLAVPAGGGEPPEGPPLDHWTPRQ